MTTPERVGSDGVQPRTQLDITAHPLTDLTSSAAAEADRLATTLKSGTAAVHAANNDKRERFSVMGGIRSLFGGAAPVSGTTPEGSPYDSLTVPTLNPVDQQLREDRARPDTKRNDLSAKDAIVQQCIALLKEGRVEDFNKLRPAGKLDFTGCDLSRLDLEGVDLRHVNLSRSVLFGTNLTGAKLQHTLFDRSDLSETVLDNAEMFKASFRFADLRKVQSAVGAQFHEANLRGAELNEGNFAGSFFSQAVLITASLIDAKFTGAHFDHAHLGGSVLTRANFERANLFRAMLFQTNGEDINFVGANLTEAQAQQALFKSTNKPRGEGSVARTNFDGAYIRGFRHDELIPQELFNRAISDRYPAEGEFPQTPQPSNEKILVDGIPGTDKVLYDAAMEELGELVGLKSVKQYVRDMMSLLKASKSRLSHGLPELDYTLHRAYTGSPGTGKTSVARILSKMLFSLGCLEKGHLVETDKSGLIAGYAGQTLEKTNTLINSSMGGTLLIDEAYALTQSKDDSFAKDAVAVLTKRLEDDRDKFCCLVCGYTEPMKEFIKSNPGLADRFDEFVEFPDYSGGELIDIMKIRMDKKRYHLDPELLASASVLLCALKEKQGEHFANGRSVRKLVEKMGLRHSSRLELEGTIKEREELVRPQVCDLPYKSMLGFDGGALPALNQLSWVGPQGETLSLNQLDVEGEFPNLSKESIELISLATRAQLEQVNAE